jgi:hypothetical protein
MIAILICLFPIGPHHCDLDAGRPTGDDWPATFGEDFFTKPALPVVEKSRRAGVAGLRSKRPLASLVFGQTQSNRGRECEAHSGNREEYDNSNRLPPCRNKGNARPSPAMLHGLTVRTNCTSPKVRA